MLGDRVSGVLAGGDDGTDADQRGPTGRRGARGRAPVDLETRERNERVYDTGEREEDESVNGEHKEDIESDGRGESIV